MIAHAGLRLVLLIAFVPLILAACRSGPSGGPSARAGPRALVLEVGGMVKVQGLT